MELFELEDLDARARALRGAAPRSAAHPAERGDARGGSLARTCRGARLGRAWRTLFAPSFVFEDRRALIRDSRRSREDARERSTGRSRRGRAPRTRVLATAGDRLALAHQASRRSTAARHRPRSRRLQIYEVDAEGRIVATVASTRTIAAPPAPRCSSASCAATPCRAAWQTSRLQLARALRDRDLDRVRAALPDDYVFHDHRRMGAGRVDRRGPLRRLVRRAASQQSPDAMIEPLYFIAVEKHGDPQCRAYLRHAQRRRRRSSPSSSSSPATGSSPGAELFELDDLDAARARFEELRPDPLRIPPNAASRANDRWQAAFEARDWEALGTPVRAGAASSTTAAAPSSPSAIARCS